VGYGAILRSQINMMLEKGSKTTPDVVVLGVFAFQGYQ